VDTTKTITHLSLCSGYEGIGLGLRRVLPNLREIAYVEIEAFAIANLVAKMEAQHLDPAPIYTDLKTFPYEQFRGKVSILSGGFPCQPFSAAGQRKATDDPRHLFPFIADGIQKCQPRIVFLENVQGILSCKTGDGEPVLQYVLRELEQMGYRATAGIFSAEEVGAPHQRKRVFILGYAQHNGLSAVTELRGNEEASNEWGKKESPTTGQSKGTSGPIDVPSVQGCSEGGESEELANAYNDGHRENRGRNKEQDSVQEEYRQEVRGGMLDRTSEELVNTNSNGHSEHSATQKEESVRGTETTIMPRSNETSELANTNISGGNKDRQPTKLWSSCTEQSPINRWPSRPSQTQQEWEEPRVTAVANSESRGTGRKSGDVTSKGKIWESTSKSSSEPIECKAESQLGRATDGTTCRVDATTNRVDRLRLLGNGVVNQTASKAFITLIQRLT
jgi:DNA (cytosine-5)-methyltransferase 1